MKKVYTGIANPSRPRPSLRREITRTCLQEQKGVGEEKGGGSLSFPRL